MCVVYVYGSRPCGKATSVKECSAGDILYTLMDFQVNLIAVDADPLLFVSHRANKCDY